jgi:phosphoglycolate phosphatase-like HAD superfamily hydrolase
MKKETIDQLIQFLTAMADHSREYALKLKALEQVAKKHPEIFRTYEEYLEELRASALALRSLTNIRKRHSKRFARNFFGITIRFDRMRVNSDTPSFHGFFRVPKTAAQARPQPVDSSHAKRTA